MPTFTIGIPTFNRAKWLKTAIEAALSQTYRDVKIIVSDNASTDNTEAVVRRFGSRVIYSRNETNIGALSNFCRLVELASGDYFSWLQDDDCIFGQFAERAVSCLEKNRQATLYGAYSVVSGTLSSLANGWLYGPPLSLDWTNDRARVMQGDLMAPLSLCGSVAIPPVIAFRLASLKKCTPGWDHSIPLFAERTILCDVAAKGKVVFDPYVAGVFRSHEKQCYQQYDSDASKQQWLSMARQLDTIPTQYNRKQRLAELLEEIDGRKNEWVKESQTWPTDIPLCQEMREALIAEPQPQNNILNMSRTIAENLMSRFSRAA